MKMFDPSLIFTLRAMTPETVKAAFEKWQKATSLVMVMDFRTDGVFTKYRVFSGSTYYSVVVFGWFAKCDCNDFKYSGPCKHIAACLPSVCSECFGRSVAVRGAKCSKCESENAPYLKQNTQRPVEQFGSVRI